MTEKLLKWETKPVHNNSLNNNFSWEQCKVSVQKFGTINTFFIP